MFILLEVELKIHDFLWWTMSHINVCMFSYFVQYFFFSKFDVG